MSDLSPESEGRAPGRGRLRARRILVVGASGAPHLAPAIGAGGWRVDEMIAHCCVAGASSNFSTPSGTTST